MTSMLLYTIMEPYIPPTSIPDHMWIIKALAGEAFPAAEPRGAGAYGFELREQSGFFGGFESHA